MIRELCERVDVLNKRVDVQMMRFASLTARVEELEAGAKENDPKPYEPGYREMMTQRGAGGGSCRSRGQQTEQEID